MTYAGLTYYEQDGVEDVMTFTAAKNLSALLEVRVFICASNNYLIINYYSLFIIITRKLS